MSCVEKQVRALSGTFFSRPTSTYQPISLSISLPRLVYFVVFSKGWIVLDYAFPMQAGILSKVPIFRPLSLRPEAEVAMKPLLECLRVISSECPRPTGFKGYQGPGALRTQIETNKHEFRCYPTQDHTASREGLFLSREPNSRQSTRNKIGGRPTPFTFRLP